MNSKINDFINSSELQTKFNDGLLIKEKYDNINVLYFEAKNDKITTDVSKKYLLIYNNKNNQILHISKENNKLLEISNNCVFDYILYFKSIKKEVTSKAEQYFKNMKKEIYKNINLDDYMDYIEKRHYAKDKSYYTSIELFYPNTLTIDYFNELVNDENKYKEKIYNEMIDINKVDIEKQLKEDVAYELFQNKIKSDPFLSRKEIMYDILKDYNYNEIVIEYKTPSEIMRTSKFKKSNYAYDFLYSTLQNENLLLHIPIKSIEKIYISEMGLAYDTNNFEELNYSMEEKIKDSFEARLYYDIPDSAYKDKEIICQYIKQDDTIINFIDNELLKDKEFIIKLLEIKPKIGIFSILDDAIFKDNNFIERCLDILISNKIDASNLLNRCDELSIDVKLITKYYQEANNDTKIEILLKIKPEILNSNEINKIITSANRYSPKLIQKITNPDTLIKLYGFDIILENICVVDKQLINDECFINYILDNSTKAVYTSNIQDLSKKYKDNMEVLRKISTHINYTDDAIDFLEVTDVKNIDTILEFAQNNAIFLNCIAQEELEKYLECEIAGYESVIKEGDETIIKTENGQFVQLENALIYQDKIEHAIAIKDKKMIEKIYESISIEMKNRNQEEISL